jgi:predicted sugar kinase
MLLELTSPCFLPLGLARHAGTPAWLGLTLRFPIVELRAQPHPHTLWITGPRANRAREHALRLGPDHFAEIEIEWAIPAHMGLSSDSMLGLSVARALAWTRGEAVEASTLAQRLALESHEAPAAHGFQRGGALLVALDGDQPVLRRAAIAHAEDAEWVFVLYLPRPPEDVSATLEAERARALRAAAPHLNAETDAVLDQSFWPAFERDDLSLFARALLRLDQLNRAALAAAGTPLAISAEARSVLDLMQAEGALACWQSLTGLGLVALVQGTDASHALRNKILAHVGHFGGTLLASVIAGEGATARARDSRLDDERPRAVVGGAG